MVFFTYAYRSLLARLRASMITMLSVALFVAGGSLGLSYYLSLSQRLVTAPPEDIIIVAKSAVSEVESRLKLESARKLMVLDGIKKEGDTPLAVRELVSRVLLANTDFSHYELPSVIRGIDDLSLRVHHATMVSGARPTTGTLEVIVGKRLADQFPQLVTGYELALPGGKGKVTGIFAANNSPLEDELWTPRSALELHTKMKGTVSSVTLIADNAALVPSLVAKINASNDVDAQAATVGDFQADHANLGTVARTVLVLLVLLSIVATFAIAMTMNAAILTRFPELAALAAIGIRKSILSRMVLVESTLLAMLGSILGVLLATLIAIKIGRTAFGTVAVDMGFSPTVLVAGLALGLVVGVLGGVPPTIQVRRLDIMEALR